LSAVLLDVEVNVAILKKVLNLREDTLQSVLASDEIETVMRRI